jgi:hypothetical protein
MGGVSTEASDLDYSVEKCLVLGYRGFSHVLRAASANFPRTNVNRWKRKKFLDKKKPEQNGSHTKQHTDKKMSTAGIEPAIS